MSLTNDMKTKVRLALREYSEHQVANMYGLRLSAVREVKMETRQQNDEFNARLQQDLFTNMAKGFTATGRRQETPLEMGLRLHEDLFSRQDQKAISFGERYSKQVPNLDYAGLEAHVMSGFFTPSGQPTPAFWGYLSQYVKKSGHTMLDILHDKEIYAPEQLERALDIDSQLEDMTQEQAIALLRRVAAKVYANAFKDPSGSSADVQDSE